MIFLMIIKFYLILNEYAKNFQGRYYFKITFIRTILFFIINVAEYIIFGLHIQLIMFLDKYI